MNETVRKYGWRTIIGLQLILGGMALFSLMMVLGSLELLLVRHQFFQAVLCGLVAAGMGWPTFFLLRRFYRVLGGKPADLPSTKPANSDWLTGRLYDDQRGRFMLVLIVLLAIFGGLAAISVYNGTKIMRTIESGGVPWLAVGFFALLFVTLVNWMIKLALAQRRFGKGELQLVTGPGRLGGVFEARFIVHGKARVAEGLRAEITCHRSDFRHRRTNPESHDADLLWWLETEIDARTVSLARGDGLVIRFDIPADLPPSGRDERTRHTEWTIALTSLPGSQNLVQFQWAIPVLAPGALLEDAAG